MKKILIICAVITLFAVNIWADTVTFKSGKKVEGNIKAITNNSVTVDLYGVTEMTYDLSDIQEINGQVVELKPAATSPAKAAPEVAPPAEVVPETTMPVTEATAITPTGKAPEEKIPGLPLGETRTAMAVIMAFVGIFLIIILILYIYTAICLQIIANKTSTANGWLAWIPIANLFLMCNIGKVKYLWLLLIFASFVPIVGGVLGPLCNLFLFGYLWYMIALARGKQGWIGAISVLPVVGLVTVGYLAFSKDSNKEDNQGAAPLPNIGGGQPA